MDRGVWEVFFYGFYCGEAAGFGAGCEVDFCAFFGKGGDGWETTKRRLENTENLFFFLVIEIFNIHSSIATGYNSDATGKISDRIGVEFRHSDGYTEATIKCKCLFRRAEDLNI